MSESLFARTCRTCGQSLPLNANMFDRDNADEMGFKWVCKMCRSLKEKQKEDVEFDERITKFDKNSFKLLETMLATGADVPHHAEIFQEIIRVMGGVSGVAGHFMAQFLGSKLGTRERTNLLSMLFKMSEKVTDSGAAVIPLEMLTDEDLEKARLEAMRKIMGPKLIELEEAKYEALKAQRRVESDREPEAVDKVPRS